MYTFGLSKSVAIFLTLFVACIPITTFFLGPRLLFYIGGVFGSYLRKKTAGRKAQILELVENEEKEYGKDRRDSDEWEEVEAYAAQSAKNGEAADREWDGVVGFFHPFWYVSLYI